MISATANASGSRGEHQHVVGRLKRLGLELTAPALALPAHPLARLLRRGGRVFNRAQPTHDCALAVMHGGGPRRALTGTERAHQLEHIDANPRSASLALIRRHARALKQRQRKQIHPHHDRPTPSGHMGHPRWVGKPTISHHNVALAEREALERLALNAWAHDHLVGPKAREVHRVVQWPL